MAGKDNVDDVFDEITRQRKQRKDAIIEECKAVVGTVDVTVAIMSYNNGHYISKTIDSVLQQEGISLEVIVYDDCSTDNSVQILEGYCGDPRFKYEVNKNNLGMSGNYDKCVKSGCGRYVVVLGSDDIIYPGHLASLVAGMDASTQSALGYTQCNWIDRDGNLIRYARHPGHKDESYSGGRDEVVDLLVYDNYITPSAVIFRRSLLNACALDDGTIHRKDMLAGDWDLFIRVAHRFPDFVFLHQATVGYRVHDSQISSQFYGSEKPLSEHAEILESNLACPDLIGRLRVHADGIWRLYSARLNNYPDEVRRRYESRSDAIRECLFSTEYDEAGELSKDFIFTIIVTTFNRPAMLKDALSSLSKQSNKSFEVILVNDCGDPVEGILSDYGFPITYIRQGFNQGLSAARNAGIKQAKGKYICFLDDDDIFLDTHLECLCEAIKSQPEDTLFYTDAWYVEEVLEGEKRIQGARSVPYAHTAFSADRLAVSNYIPVNTWCVPRRFIQEAGEFDIRLPALEDWEFFQRLVRISPPVHVPQPTVEVRVRGTAADHMSHVQRKNFPALFRDIYSRFPTDSDRVLLARQEMLDNLDAEMAGLPSKTGTLSPASSIQNWLAKHELLPCHKHFINEYLGLNDGGISLAIFVVCNGDRSDLERTIRSLAFAGSNYCALEVYVFSSDASDDLFCGVDFKAVRHERGQLISAMNSSASACSADWFMVVDAGVEFIESGFSACATSLISADHCCAVYADDVATGQDGVLIGGSFRPGFNLDLLISFPASMVKHWFIRRTEFLSNNGFDAELPESFELDFLLRLIESNNLNRFGHINEALLSTKPVRLEDVPDEKRAILSHLSRRGYSADLIPSLPGRYRVSYNHLDQPLVSIIIPTKDQLPMLQRCVESLLEKTRYPNYELLIVDNNSETTEAREWMAGVERMGEEKVRVLRYPYPFNYSAINNMAAREARGEYLVLLNNDTAIISESWLDDLLNYAQRPEVGIVGAKLLYPDGRIQHAGVILGLRGPAEHPFIGEPMDAAGYMQRLQVDQNYSAVTAACLMIRKSIYDEVGGLDEQVFKVSYNDIDLCLKVGQQGYLIVWTPHAVVMHEGSVSQKQVDPATQEAKRKRFLAEQDAMYEKWLPQLANDPAYNGNLALTGSGFSLETNVDLTWRPLSWRPLPLVLAHNADPWGCGNYRVIKPHKAMKEAGLIDGAVSNRLLEPAELARLAPDVIVFQRQTRPENLENMARARRFSSAFKVYELDDYLPNTPVKNAHRATLSKDVVKLLRKGLGLVDRFVVSTPALANALADYHPDIRVIENRLPLDWWGQLEVVRKPLAKPRVGWAGGVGHQGDLELIADVVRDLAGEVDWVFFGMCPEKLKPYMTEFYPGVDIDLYPQKLASLNLDLALAPLEDNLFNACKSNLRLLEYGVCGFPVIASDIECYRGNLPVTLVKNRYRDWMDAIRGQLADREALRESAAVLQKVVRQDWMLDGSNLEQWRSVWLPD